MSKLISKLEETQEAVFNNTENSTTNSSTTLLLEAPKESLEILTLIGLDSKLNHDLKVISEQKAFKHFKDTIGNAFSGESIKMLCNLYGLKIKMARDYKGAIDYSVLGTKIKEFCDKNDIVPGYTKFYIMAPSETFNSDKFAKSNVTLFYKEGHHHIKNITENDRLIEVYSWGEDLSEFRVFHTLFSKPERKSDSPNSTTTTILSFIFILFGLFLGFGNEYAGLLFNIIGITFFLFNGLITKHTFTTWSENE